MWWMIVACRPPGEGPPSSGDDALDVLIEQVLAPSGIGPDDAAVYEVGPVAPDQALTDPYGGAVEHPEAATLFLVDHTPAARWGHDVDWVFVGDNGSLSSETLTYWPVVDGSAYVPWFHEVAWGIVVPVEDPATLGDDLPVWDSVSGARRAAPPPADPCRPERPNRALTVSGMRRRAVLADAANWAELLRGRGYEVDTLAAQEGDPVTGPELADALAALAAGPHLSELVITYAGHGVAGALTLGDEGELGDVDVDTIVGALAAVRTDHLVLVIDACESGSIASTLPARLQAAGMVSTDIVVHAAVPEGVLAYDVGQEGGMFSRAMAARVAETRADEPIPWGELDLGVYHEDEPGSSSETLETGVTPGSDGLAPQQEVSGAADRRKGELFTSTHPTTGECLASWVDTTAYDRRTYVDGLGLGEDDGLLEMMSEAGAWTPVEWRFWDDDLVRAVLPMRADGFPANGASPAIPYAGPGLYWMRATRVGGIPSDPQPVRLEYQVYEQTWTPVTTPTDFPDWVELWHPYTVGGTVQLSRAWDATTGSTPIPSDLGVLDAATSQAHGTAPALLGVGSWSYELAPGIRDLRSAFDQSQPDVQYWGFRARFPDDEVQEHVWGFTLIYD